MNWTGGGLSRSKNARNSLTAKQKAYFAKARGRVENGRRLSPAIHSFDLGHWKPTTKVSSSPRESHKSLRQPPKQKTLHEFENVRPLADRLETLKPRHESSKQKHEPLQSSISQTILPNGDTTNYHDPIVIGSSESVSSVTSTRSQLYEPKAAQSSPANLNSATSMQEMRRRLLGMNDWVGIHGSQPASKPVRMTFADPADRDLIGKRRRVERKVVHPAKRRRLLPQATLFSRMDRRTIPTAQDQYYSVDDVSVRIGSAVDRSTARTLKEGGEIHSQFSDEILDNGTPASVHLAPPPSGRGHGGWRSSPLRLSDFGDREILTPSAFMEDASQRSRSRSPEIGKSPILPLSPVRSVESLKYFESTSSDWELTDYLPPKDPGLRLVFGDTPRGQASIPDLARASSVLDNPSIHDTQAPKSASRLSTISPDSNVPHPDAAYIYNHTKVDRPGIMRDEETQWPSQYQASNSKPSALRPRAKRNKSPNMFPRDEQGLQLTDNASTAGSDTGGSPEIFRERPKSRKQPRLNEEMGSAAMQTINEIPMQKSIVVTTNEPPKEKIPTEEPISNNIPNTTDDEEAAWRKIVFGDDCSEDDASQRSNVGFDELGPEHGRYACTQPSLIAEIDTSPLKQNPHLVDETFDASTFYHSEHSPISQDVAGPSTKGQEIAHRNRAESSSLLAEAEFNQEELDQRSALPPKSGLRRDRSSLMGEPSNSSQPTDYNPIPHISSDELQRSPDKIPFVSSESIPGSSSPVNSSILDRGPDTRRRGREKVVYKKPPRYVGEGSGLPAEPTVLGRRVLRSGRMADGGARGRGKGVKSGRGEGRGRHEEIESVDDGDEIIDD